MPSTQFNYLVLVSFQSCKVADKSVISALQKPGTEAEFVNVQFRGGFWA
jgi:hypothetical protein